MHFASGCPWRQLWNCSWFRKWQPSDCQGLSDISILYLFLKQPHQLPVCFKLQFKVLFMTFKALHVPRPTYLKGLSVPLCSETTIILRHINSSPSWGSSPTTEQSSCFLSYLPLPHEKGSQRREAGTSSRNVQKVLEDVSSSLAF